MVATKRRQTKRQHPAMRVTGHRELVSLTGMGLAVQAVRFQTGDGGDYVQIEVRDELRGPALVRTTNIVLPIEVAQALGAELAKVEG